MKKPVSLPKLKKKALDLFAQSVKLRAAKEGKLICYTCHCKLELRSSNTHLGHYLSRGAYPGLTFHPDNSRPQCYRCNYHLYGAIVEFRERLICEIGIDRVESLEGSRHVSVKWSRGDLHEMIDRYSSEIKELNEIDLIELSNKYF
jgi:hypothetical protein